MRIAAYAAIGLLGGIALLVIGVVVVGEFWPEILTGVPPKIARGIDFGVDRRADAEFDARIRKVFPAGTTESKLKADLAMEGFAPGYPGSPCGENNEQCRGLRQMYYVWGMFPCGNELFVTWTADNKGTVSKVTGSYQYVCV